MKTVLDDAFAYAVLSIVEEIPVGTVATYGQIARLMGREKNARLVARVLSHAQQYGQFPCHRVVNHADGWRLGGRNKRHCWRRRAWCAGMRATWI